MDTKYSIFRLTHQGWVLVHHNVVGENGVPAKELAERLVANLRSEDSRRCRILEITERIIHEDK